MRVMPGFMAEASNPLPAIVQPEHQEESVEENEEEMQPIQIHEQIQTQQRQRPLVLDPLEDERPLRHLPATVESGQPKRHQHLASLLVNNNQSQNGLSQEQTQSSTTHLTPLTFASAPSAVERIPAKKPLGPIPSTSPIQTIQQHQQQQQQRPAESGLRVVTRPYEGLQQESEDTKSTTLGSSAIGRRRRQWVPAPSTHFAPKESPNDETKTSTEDDEEEMRAFAEKIMRDREKRESSQQKQAQQAQPKQLNPPITVTRSPVMMVIPVSTAELNSTQCTQQTQSAEKQQQQQQKLIVALENLTTRTVDTKQDEILLSNAAAVTTSSQQRRQQQLKPTIPAPTTHSKQQRRGRPPPTPLTEREQMLRQSLVQLTTVCEKHSENLERIAGELSALRIAAERATELLPPVFSAPESQSQQPQSKQPQQKVLPTRQNVAQTTESRRKRRQVSHGNGPLISSNSPSNNFSTATTSQSGGGRIVASLQASELII